FLEGHREEFNWNLIVFLKMLAVAILSFIIVISWLCYGILKFGVFNGLLEVLRNPYSDSDRRGIDVIKIISISMFNMDYRPSAVKLFVSTLAMFTMIYVILDVV